MSLPDPGGFRDGRLTIGGMSIWSSIRIGDQDDDVHAIRRDKADDYTGEGPATAWIDVATATSWHDRIRLGISEDEGGQYWDADLLIDVPNAEKLVADLLEAIAYIKERRQSV